MGLASVPNRHRTGDSYDALSLPAVLVPRDLAHHWLMARELATSIADSVAEGIRRDTDRDPVVTQWRTRAAALLPDGDVDVLDRGDGLHIAVVKWRAQASSDGEAVCAEPSVGAKLACVSVAFAR